jgi:hypothetical protein
MTTHTKRDEMLASFQGFIRQRPGFDPNNYGDAASYRADVRRAGRDLREAGELLRAVSLRRSCAIPENKGQRLSWTGKGWEYTAGQYFPTEYRAAACQLLASALWDWYAESLPEKTHTHNQETGEITERFDGLRAGDWIRRAARRDLGPRLARRWFS